ncbi:beta galactosidase jelly roll domain-containing protein [bacterium]|nr:beta galactosidase jelly roll domain-containing protein [bacterium]
MKMHIWIAFTMITAQTVLAVSPKREVNLRGKWRFEVGDNMEYADPEYDDSSWEKIRVPDQWEDQGFPGYDGYAWYRTTFKISDQKKDRTLLLYLGYIDDVDQVYLNGHYINGRGTNDENYVSAYKLRRIYQIPAQFLNFDGKNVLAVRVYDEWGDGGIVSGKVGIYSQKSAYTTIDLAGHWKFHEGDDLLWAAGDLDDRDWESLVVPAIWESQGHPGLDGYGWYRIKTHIPGSISGEQLILFIGAIDDADEVYINGQKISSKGRFPGEDFREYNQRFYNHERLYYIPGDVIRYGAENTIAVRVFDSGGDGGIYRGPVGITTRKEFSKFRKTYRRNDNDFSDFLEDIFDF